MARIVEHAGDRPRRPVDVIGIAERDASLALDPVERRGVGEIIAVMMRNGNVDLLARLIGGGEQRLAVLDLERHRAADEVEPRVAHQRSEEHTSELQSLMRISYAVFCLKKQ